MEREQIRPTLISLFKNLPFVDISTYLSPIIKGGGILLAIIQSYDDRRPMNAAEYVEFAKNGYMGDPISGEPPVYSPRKTI